MPAAANAREKMTTSTLIIPVENQVRELDAKLLLAGVAAEHGFSIILGSRAFVHYKVASIPRGVYLAKSMRKLSKRMFSILRSLGHEIVAWDEEGLVRFAGAEYYRRRLSPEVMQEISHLIAWGEDNADALREYPGYHGVPIHITGNPRIDLIRPELRGFYAEDVSQIKQRYGDLVLVNTNFGQVNHYFPRLSEMQAAVAGRGPDADNVFDVRRGRLKLDIFARFKEMLPAVCRAFPEKKIVLRPHPSENHAPWTAIAAEHSNLHVINEGSVVPWLLAAQALVANGCTTLVEAAIVGLPQVNYRPLNEPKFEDPLPQQFGFEANDVHNVIELLRQILSDELEATQTPAQQALLDKNIASLRGPLAAERIIQVLVDAAYDRQQPCAPPLGDRVSGWLQTHTRTVIKKINMRRPGHRNNMRLHDHRFPPVTATELQQRIERLGALIGRFSRVRVEQTSQHMFCISDPSVVGRHNAGRVGRSRV
jgi:surface carbohydrate biosynthesis protein